MEKEKVNGVISDAGRTAKHAGEKAAYFAKKSLEKAKEVTEDGKRTIDLKTLQPIFLADIASEDFQLTKFIQVINKEKKYYTNPVCQGSIGRRFSTKGYQVVTIFKEYLKDFNLSFYPDAESEFYFVNPTNPREYIALDEYYDRLKILRINELQVVAQDLGAKHFRVSFKEERISFTKKKVQVKVQAPKEAAEFEHDVSMNSRYNGEIVAENTFAGHDPVEPKLCYMKNDPTIQTLIKMRLNASTPLFHQKLQFKMSTTSGLKENDAAKIDAVLKGLKVNVGGNATVTSEAQHEARSYLEYEIEF